MKKKVEVSVIKDAKDGYSTPIWYEAMESMKHNLEGYFKAFVNHCALFSIDPYTFAAYVTLRDYAKVVNVVAREEVAIDFRKNKITTDVIFFDSTIDGDSISKRETGFNVVELFSKRYGTLALYYIDKKSLVTTDWSHNSTTIDMAIHVFPQVLAIMEKYGYTKYTTEKKGEEEEITFKPEDIIVGCDPEFEVVDIRNQEICSADYVAQEGNVIKGCRKEDKIGVDGAGAPLELRPDAGSPEEVAKHMAELFDVFNKGMPNHVLAVSGHRHAIGGHIHIGLGYRVIPPKGLLMLLDDFIGSKTINLSGKARGGYKFLGAYEDKSYGFEYRTPPAIIFYNEKLTEIFLRLARNIVWKFKTTKNFIEYNNPPTPDDYMEVGGLSREDVEYLNDTIASLSDKMAQNKILIAAWGNSVKKVTPKKVKESPTIVFSDEWDESIEEELSKKLISKYKNKAIKIKLFGLKEDKGLVSNIDISGFDVISMTSRSHRVIRDNPDYAMIGLPYAFRKDKSVYKTHKENVIESITKLVKVPNKKAFNKIILD